MDQKILKKIQKCLKLAKSSNANEAAIALRRAQKLMAQHGVTADDLELAGISRHDVHAGDARQPARWQVGLMSVVSEAFGCEPIWVAKMNGGDVSFIGPDAQPEIAGYAFTVLFRQLKKARADHIASQGKRLKRSTKTRRGDLFAEAWIYAVAEKVQRLAMSEKTCKLIADYTEREFGKLTMDSGRAHKPQQRDRASQLAGHVAGKKAQLNHGMSGTQTERLEAM